MEFNKCYVDELDNKTNVQQEKNQKFIENLKKCFIAATKETEGYKAFKYIKKICLWDEKYFQTTAEQELYKKARRDVWLLIREYIPDNVLANIEIKDKTDIFDDLSK